MRKTKIVCTLGPSTDAPGVLKQVMEAGMNVARFNFSHATHEEHLDRLKKVRAMRTELGLYVATLLDTKGPEIRVCKFKNGSVELKEGAKFHLNQALVLAIVSIVGNLIGFIPLLGTIVSWVVSVFVLVCVILGIVYAAKEEEKQLPLIGSIKILK